MDKESIRRVIKWSNRCYVNPRRTDTSYFHDYVLGKAEIRFLRGRIRFVGATQPAPFPSMVVVYEGKGNEMVCDSGGNY